jgi:hypothetical protein
VPIQGAPRGFQEADVPADVRAHGQQGGGQALARGDQQGQHLPAPEAVQGKEGKRP